MQLHISQSLLDPYTFRSVSHIFFFKPYFVCVYVFLPFSMSHINCFLGLGNPSVGIHQEADAKSGLEMQATYWRKSLWRREWRRKQASAEKACRAQYRTGLWCDRAEKRIMQFQGLSIVLWRFLLGWWGIRSTHRLLELFLVHELQEQASTSAENIPRHWLAIIWGNGTPRETQCWIPRGDSCYCQSTTPLPTWDLTGTFLWSPCGGEKL